MRVGTNTSTHYANIQLFTEPGPSGGGFFTGEVDVDVCKVCGKHKLS